MQSHIGQLQLTVHTRDNATQLFALWAQDSQRRYVSTCVAYNFVLAHDIPAVMHAMQQADMVVADGMPLVWIQRRMGFHHAERIYGPDVLLDVCRVTAEQPVRHFFYGGQADILDQLITRLQADFPNLTVAGTLLPGQLPDQDIVPESAHIEQINRTQPHIIWVGLGAPRQDIWMAAYRPHLAAPLMIGVGAAFDFLSGTKPQAPRWMQSRGLEWLFRLMTEPKRLWKRYLLYNPRFVWMIARWAINIRFLNEHSA